MATASVVKDAADDPNCQGLREQWYYLRFYVRRTMPPTDQCIEYTQYNLFPRLVGIKSYDCRNWNISQYFNKNIINLREAANQRAASNHVTPM